MSTVPTKRLEGDVAVGRNVSTGGDVNVQGGVRVGHNLRVEGWLDAPNITGINKGLYATEEKLRQAYPRPHDGWCALVGVELPAQLYVGEKGAWVLQRDGDGEPVLTGQLTAECSSLLECLQGRLSTIEDDLIADINHEVDGLKESVSTIEQDLIPDVSREVQGLKESVATIEQDLIPDVSREVQGLKAEAQAASDLAGSAYTKASATENATENACRDLRKLAKSVEPIVVADLFNAAEVMKGIVRLDNGVIEVSDADYISSLIVINPDTLYRLQRLGEESAQGCAVRFVSYKGEALKPLSAEGVELEQFSCGADAVLLSPPTAKYIQFQVKYGGNSPEVHLYEGECGSVSVGMEQLSAEVRQDIADVQQAVSDLEEAHSVDIDSVRQMCTNNGAVEFYGFTWYADSKSENVCYNYLHNRFEVGGEDAGWPWNDPKTHTARTDVLFVHEGVLWQRYGNNGLVQLTSGNHDLTALEVDVNGGTVLCRGEEANAFIKRYAAGEANRGKTVYFSYNNRFARSVESEESITGWTLEFLDVPVGRAVVLGGEKGYVYTGGGIERNVVAQDAQEAAKGVETLTGDVGELHSSVEVIRPQVEQLGSRLSVVSLGVDVAKQTATQAQTKAQQAMTDAANAAQIAEQATDMAEQTRDLAIEAKGIAQDTQTVVEGMPSVEIAVANRSCEGDIQCGFKVLHGEVNPETDRVVFFRRHRRRSRWYNKAIGVNDENYTGVICYKSGMTRAMYSPLLHEKDGMPENQALFGEDAPFPTFAFAPVHDRQKYILQDALDGDLAYSSFADAVKEAYVYVSVSQKSEGNHLHLAGQRHVLIADSRGIFEHGHPLVAKWGMAIYRGDRMISNLLPIKVAVGFSLSGDNSSKTDAYVTIF